MLLIVFKDKVWVEISLAVITSTVFLQDSARQFYLKFNGQPFNSIESAICRLVFVQRVEITKGSQGATLPAPGGRDVVELPSCPVCLERLVGGVVIVLWLRA